MIAFDKVQVQFTEKDRNVQAVRNASFNINKGEIFGIVGTSGAGKSTLLRTINLLQRPTGGKVLIDQQDVTNLKGEALRHLRGRIGMIFQHFNLIHSKTIFENVAFALKAAGKKTDEIKSRVPEVLELVGLSDKAQVFPSALSGGQKQRVGIARAIANNPDILLCDEPTSALDLETTESILALLKQINSKIGVTTVIISHEMHVIKSICDRVAVMTNGDVVELASVFDVFTHPEHQFSKELVERSLSLELPQRLLKDNGKKLLKVIYRGDKAEESVISDTVKAFDVDVNILHGKIEYLKGNPFGVLVLELKGLNGSVVRAEEYLKERTFKVEVINDKN